MPWAAWMLAWSLAKLAALVPVSLGGIGVRQLAQAAFMAPFAVTAALAVAQSLVWESLLLALGLVGGAASIWVRGLRLGDASVDSPTGSSEDVTGVSDGS